uniref:Uncharacterized protein n=1 Tax=Candidatus Kentrum eta TaxID=2126337 RepID=A0A450V931_9GAMM|nr:MAG: hypothetical protein BECKH772B_GA0070898_102263 [Candidatus Kentron sp. H]VFK01441.1 MAG: hypothetical protein BECKH772A_GA0070896_102273 [Candidatus Kentron sp. H]VFK05024.1 MAG: hypothetical protein BECKH772C_GA0070978_102303 [Candidatus Kentron sp. H]
METWEQLLVGAAAILLLLWFWPSARKAVKEAPKGTQEDWLGVIKPIGWVIAFVIFLILIGRA